MSLIRVWRSLSAPKDSVCLFYSALLRHTGTEGEEKELTRPDSLETLCLAEEREGQRKPLTQSQATATALAPLLKALARLLGTSPARLIEHVRIPRYLLYRSFALLKRCEREQSHTSTVARYGTHGGPPGRMTLAQ